MTLRALVIGAGWAGEGHTLALRAAGVEVAAMCGRRPEPARAAAERLAIPVVRHDWHKTLEEFRPDIVAIATPARPQCEIVQAAARLGCHILCDKPLGTNAAEARTMLLAVTQAGVKHAYGATSRYSPALIHARALLAGGLIGQVREVESIAHYDLSPLLPHHWFHRIDQGGGLLNASFTHKLEQVLYATGGRAQAAAGEARRLIDQAPAGATLHDFRQLFDSSFILTPEQAAASEWKEVDADLAYTVMLQLRLPGGQPASALFQGSAMAVSPQPNYLAFYGTRGTLHLTGRNSPDHLEHYEAERREWAHLPVPPEIIESLPQIEDPVQRDWNQLACEFVADLRGEGYAGYPTFRDGWVAAQVIEAARRGQGWHTLEEAHGHRGA